MFPILKLLAVGALVDVPNGTNGFVTSCDAHRHTW